MIFLYLTDYWWIEIWPPEGFVEITQVICTDSCFDGLYSNLWLYPLRDEAFNHICLIATKGKDRILYKDWRPGVSVVFIWFASFFPSRMVFFAHNSLHKEFWAVHKSRKMSSIHIYYISKLWHSRKINSVARMTPQTFVWEFFPPRIWEKTWIHLVIMKWWYMSSLLLISGYLQRVYK